MAPPKNPALIQVVEQTVIFLDGNVFGMIERMLERERPRMGLTRYRVKWVVWNIDEAAQKEAKDNQGNKDYLVRVYLGARESAE